VLRWNQSCHQGKVGKTEAKEGGEEGG